MTDWDDWQPQWTPEQIAMLRDVCGLPPGDEEPPEELLVMVVRMHAREYCGLLPGDRELQPGDVAVIDAARAIIDGDGDP